MRIVSAANVQGRPGKASVWTVLLPSRRGRKIGDTQPASTQPLSTRPVPMGISSLDGVRAVFWQAYRHLFPPHSLAAQTPNGNIVISWSVMNEPNARHPYAAPVMLRLDEALVDLVANSDAAQRQRIAQTHESTLREGLRGYDPFALIPKARVVSLG